MKPFSYFRTTFFAFIFSLVLCACSNHSFKAKTVTSASRYPAAIERSKTDKRYFIMQSGINIYNITSIDLDQAKQQMTVTLDKVDSSHLVYLKNPEPSGAKTKEGKTSMQPEIFIYMRDSTSYTLDEPHTIPLNKVARMELLD